MYRIPFGLLFCSFLGYFRSVLFLEIYFRTREKKLALEQCEVKEHEIHTYASEIHCIESTLSTERNFALSCSTSFKKSKSDAIIIMYIFVLAILAVVSVFFKMFGLKIFKQNFLLSPQPEK